MIEGGRKAKDQKEVRTAMNKYELALVISARLDDNTRADVLERAKDYISRHGGTVGETEEWGKRKLAYEIQKEKAFSLRPRTATARTNLNIVCASWTTSFAILSCARVNMIPSL